MMFAKYLLTAALILPFSAQGQEAMAPTAPLTPVEGSNLNDPAMNGLQTPSPAAELGEVQSPKKNKPPVKKEKKKESKKAAKKNKKAAKKAAKKATKKAAHKAKKSKSKKKTTSA